MHWHKMPVVSRRRVHLVVVSEGISTLLQTTVSLRGARSNRFGDARDAVVNHAHSRPAWLSISRLLSPSGSFIVIRISKSTRRAQLPGVRARPGSRSDSTVQELTQPSPFPVFPSSRAGSMHRVGPPAAARRLHARGPKLLASCIDRAHVARGAVTRDRVG